MYTEENKSSINWGNLIKKSLVVLIIAFIVLFIIWLFAKNNNNNVNVDYDNTTNNSTNNGNSNILDNVQNNNIYSKEFLEGYRYFHDTAKEYFLISELPENGKTLKYTLQEFIDKQLLFAWEYKDKKTCDSEASYAYVTNIDGKYKLTVTLVCGTEVSRTVEDLGCNQLCLNGNCQNVTDQYITEYQFKQAYKTTETVYSCPSGYTKSGSKCVKNNSSTVNATKNVEYVCPSGYTKSGSGSSTKCTKTNSGSINATLQTNYSCPSGYTLSGTTCYKTSSTSTDAKYNYTYSCPSGYTLNGSKCTKTESVNATYNSSSSCPSGYTLNGSKCTKTTTIDATPKAATCPSGYTLSGSMCVKNLYADATANTTYSCPQGTPINNGRACRIYSTKSYSESYEIYHGTTYNGCSYSGSYTEKCTAYSGCVRTYYKYSCTGTTYKDVAATAKTTYTCPNGYTASGTGSSTNCVKIDKVNPTSSGYTCPSGYTLSGSKCTKTESVNASSNGSYTCPSGYSLSGSKCTKTTSTPATSDKHYYCDGNAVLSGTKCYSSYSDSKSASKSSYYTCPSGYSLSGSKCTYTSSENKDAVKDTTYTCPSGYTKVGIGSESKCTKGSTSTINATKSTKEVTKYRYKWSDQETLEGWERTGEVRKSKVDSSNTTTETEK